MPLGRPAAHHDIRSKPCQPLRRTAFGAHSIDLGMLLVAADERDPSAVRRQAGRGRLRESRRQAAADAAGGVHGPQIVVADEYDRFAVQRRVAQVAWLGHDVDSNYGWRNGGADGPTLWSVPWDTTLRPPRHPEVA